MRPSDTRTRQKKDRLQQARNARGKVWQNDLLDILCGIPKVWCRGWPADYSGQPYDIEATIDGRSWGIECTYTLFFPLKSAILPPAANAIAVQVHTVTSIRLRAGLPDCFDSFF